jgi:hypothetical protein
MSIEQLIKKKEECMISGFLEEGVFSLSWLAAPSSFLFFFYLIGNPNISFLQNSPYLSRQFTFT